MKLQEEGKTEQARKDLGNYGLLIIFTCFVTELSLCMLEDSNLICSICC